MCGDQPTPDGIANNEHDNRNRLGCVPGCQRRGRGIRSDDINLQANQLRCEVGEPIEVSLGPAPLDDDVVSVNIAELAQPVYWGVEEVASQFRRRTESE